MTWLATVGAFIKARILPIILGILAIAIPWAWAARERRRRIAAEEHARIADSLRDVERKALLKQATAATDLQRELAAAQQERDQATVARGVLERELARRRGEIEAAGDDVDALAALGNESFGRQP